MKLMSAILIIATVMVNTYMTIPSFVTADVTITVIPTERHGKVGDSVYVIGTINKTNGLYQIWFGNLNVAQANATGNVVNATFPVPKLPGGNYTMTLTDVDTSANATTTFVIDTAYYIQAKQPTSPEQLQQNSTVAIWVNATGGTSNTVYHANITVKSPTPANQTYWAIVTLSNTTDTGEGHNTTVVYPTHFSGTPHTNYTGTYGVSFNRTRASTTFSIGLTDRTEYHRSQLINIKAAGYKPSENVMTRITFGGKTISPEINPNATSGGLILADWPIPPNASIGTYMLRITSVTNLTKKNPPDVQNFTIPGYSVNLATRNLAGEIVANVTVRVYQNETSIVNATSTSAGLVQLKLEKENYMCQAFYRSEKIGERWVNVTGPASIDFYCNLTNLRIMIIALLGEVEVPIPEVKIHLAPENETRITGLNGTAIVNSLLPNHDYTLNASRYDMAPFNTTSIQQLPAIDWFSINITCPSVTLEVLLTDGQSHSIKDDLRVTAQELMGGLYYENYTVNGTAALHPAIGRYSVAAYGKIGDNYVKLNETSVDLFENKQLPIICKLYGLNISIKVVDYFGQLIPNANTAVYKEELGYTSSSETGGLTTFNNIIGGNLQIVVHLSNQPTPLVVTTVFVDSTQTIQIKVDKYVVLAGMLVETSQLATVIIIVLLIILLVSIEVYRRKRPKPEEKPS